MPAAYGLRARLEAFHGTPLRLAGGVLFAVETFGSRVSSRKYAAARPLSLRDTRGEFMLPDYNPKYILLIPSA